MTTTEKMAQDHEQESKQHDSVDDAIFVARYMMNPEQARRELEEQGATDDEIKLIERMMRGLGSTGRTTTPVSYQPKSVKHDPEKMAQALALVQEYALDKKPTGDAEVIAWCSAGFDKILAAYNDVKGTDASAKEVGEVFKHLENLRDEYNKASRDRHYKDIKGRSDSMMWAINHPHYKTIKIVHGKKNDNFKELRGEADKRIDLLKANELCKGTFGAKSSWAAELHKAWLAFLARGCLETISEEVTAEEIKAAKVEGMSDDDAKKKVIGERFGKALEKFDKCDFVDKLDDRYQAGINLLSNGKLEDYLVNTVKAMIGDSEEMKQYMPRLRDVRYILKVYAKRSRKQENGIEYVKEKEFADMIMDILRCKVCGIDYTDIIKIK